ncbi:MAG: hypothetical protein EOO05_00635 [Chitinophagaceae bacterium]|nr:MAG: hypothetical protein EOO05_00635 [Chitinophagaceae bacterium]
MLTKEEQSFLDYWQVHRLKKRLRFRQLAVGLPLGVVLVLAILINFFSGWYKRADMEINSMSPSQMITIAAAGFGIIIFVALFSAKHRWDINEQYYKELLAKKEKHEIS